MIYNDISQVNGVKLAGGYTVFTFVFVSQSVHSSLRQCMCSSHNASAVSFPNPSLSPNYSPLLPYPLPPRLPLHPLLPLTSSPTYPLSPVMSLEICHVVRLSNFSIFFHRSHGLTSQTILVRTRLQSLFKPNYKYFRPT